MTKTQIRRLVKKYGLCEKDIRLVLDPDGVDAFVRNDWLILAYGDEPEYLADKERLGEGAFRPIKIRKDAADILCPSCFYGKAPTPEYRRRRHSQETVDRAIKLYKEGHSLRSIGRELGIHHTTVKRWVSSVPQD